MYEVPGTNFRTFTIDVNQIDQDYQMIDSHIEESIKKKIQAFEYIDFSKLISKKNSLREEDSQKMEIINCNGASYFVPASDCDNVSINTYFKWEQAFRVFSNILTTKFPDKVTELLQYNHSIHRASMTYVWDNVYMLMTKNFVTTLPGICTDHGV